MVVILDVLFYVCVGAIVVCGVFYPTNGSFTVSKSDALVGVTAAVLIAFLFWGFRVYQSADICPQCEAQVEEEYDFCPACGEALEDK